MTGFYQATHLRPPRSIPPPSHLCLGGGGGESTTPIDLAIISRWVGNLYNSFEIKTSPDNERGAELIKRRRAGKLIEFSTPTGVKREKRMSRKDALELCQWPNDGLILRQRIVDRVTFITWSVLG